MEISEDVDITCHTPPERCKLLQRSRKNCKK